MVTPYVPADRLARFRALDQRGMPDTCTVTHTANDGGQNPDGSPVPGTVTTTTGIPCRLVTGPNAIAALIALRLAEVASAILYVPVGTAVAFGDVIAKGGMTYEAVGTNAGESFQTSLAIGVKVVT